MKNRRDVLKYVPALPALADSLLSAEEAKHRRPVGSGEKYLILACDGGGMRGYLSSLLLQKLNQDFQIFGANNQKINLYAGTSTGGLIALGLAGGKTIDSVVELYKESGAQIFYPLTIQPACLLSATARLQAGIPDEIEALWQVLFDNIGEPSLRTVLEGFIPGDPLLNSFANKVMVATFQLGLLDPNSPIGALW